METERHHPELKAYNNVLKDYVKVVYREMYHLRDDGGRQYKVINGKFISYINGLYAYGFDLESELYLSDDSPVSLTVGTMVASGTVMLSDGFQIVVLVDKHFGQNISSGFLRVEPWKLLQKLNEKLCEIGPNDKIALKLIEEGPYLASNDPISTIPFGQENAIKKALDSDITVIWGPPGTGKTHTMATLARKYIAQGKSVLIVSHSNISVDAVIYKICLQMHENKQLEHLINGKVLRYGYVRDESLKRVPLATSFNYVLTKNSGLKIKYDELTKKSEELYAKARTTNSQECYSEVLKIEKEIKEIRAKVKELEKLYVANAQLVGTTISKVYMDSLFDGRKYDVVMFDEASMAYVPQIVCAASFAKQHFICVGDFRQLPPIVQSDAKILLELDIFSYLEICDRMNNIHPHKWLVMLNEQRRMHPLISLFPSKAVYKGLLKNHESVANKHTGIVKSEPLSGKPMNLVDLAGTYSASYKNNDNSRFNILSAIISFGTALKAEISQNEIDLTNENAGIITPYSAQARLIRAMIQDNENSRISCATVHQFQGSERNVIVFDAVESYPMAKVGWLLSKNDNNSVTRLINVAITRARGKFIAVANSKFWKNKMEDTNNLFYQMLMHMEETGSNIIAKRNNNFEAYIQSLEFGKNIECFMPEENAFDELLKDIAKAKSKVIISFPDANFHDDSRHKELFDALQMRQKNGIEVLVKSKVSADLPPEWSSISHKSDDARFPLILIDDRSVWYGLPFSKGNFKEPKNGVSYNSICKLAFRIVGKHTINMIKSLTDLEYYTEGDIRNKLTPLTATYVATSKGLKLRTSLSEYVSENKFCSDCGDSMKLAISKNRNPYLRCSSCAYREYLTDVFVNRYLNRENPRCPTCHKEMQAKLTSKGMFIICDGGHFVKVMDI